MSIFSHKCKRFNAKGQEQGKVHPLEILFFWGCKEAHWLVHITKKMKHWVILKKKYRSVSFWLVFMCYETSTLGKFHGIKCVTFRNLGNTLKKSLGTILELVKTLLTWWEHQHSKKSNYWNGGHLKIWKIIQIIHYICWLLVGWKLMSIEQFFSKSILSCVTILALKRIIVHTHVNQIT